MDVVDRIMRAYLKKRDLSDEQAAIARTELSKFVHELMFGLNHQPDQKDAMPNQATE